jgi:hypothetical protein
MGTAFARTGTPTGGIQSYGGDGINLAINHESTGTFRITYNKLAVVPAVFTTAQHGSDASYTATPGYVSQESMYVYTRNQQGQLTDEMFSVLLYF